ncbi:hypothetical protein ABE042_07335 [Viridibacillus arvi]
MKKIKLALFGLATFSLFLVSYATTYASVEVGRLHFITSFLNSF